MSEESQAVDETASFVTSVDDSPVVQPEEPSKAEEGSATPEAEPSTESKDESDDKQAEANTAEAEPEAEPKKQSRAQKRVQKAVRQAKEAELRAARAEAELKQMKQSQFQENYSEDEPKREDFEKNDDYLDALDKYDSWQAQAQQQDQSSEQEGKAEPEAQVMTDSQKVALEVIKEQVEEFKEKYPDFDEVALADDVSITAEMLEALAECDDSAKVMYHLGQNKDLAASIADKSPVQQMREIARLDLTVKVTPPKPQKTPKAAEPIAPVGGSDAQQKAVGDMSFAEYEAYMNGKEAKPGSGW